MAAVLRTIVSIRIVCPFFTLSAYSRNSSIEYANYYILDRFLRIEDTIFESTPLVSLSAYEVLGIELASASSARLIKWSVRRASRYIRPATNR